MIEKNRKFIKYLHDVMLYHVRKQQPNRRVTDYFINYMFFQSS